MIDNSIKKWHFLAETERFELSVRHSSYDGLANRWFQPLTHVSSALAERVHSVGLCSNQHLRQKSVQMAELRLGA